MVYRRGTFQGLGVQNPKTGEKNYFFQKRKSIHVFPNDHAKIKQKPRNPTLRVTQTSNVIFVTSTCCVCLVLFVSIAKMSNCKGYDLISAITFNDLKTAKTLLNSEPSLSTFQCYSSRTALHYACLHDRPQIAKYLVSLDKTPLTKSDKAGHTPIQLAKRHGNMATLRVLARMGCTPPLHKPGYPHARDLLLAAASASATSLRRSVGVFQAWVNWRNSDGRCALHWGILRGDVDVVETLLELGANPDRPDRWGVTPRMEATRVGGGVAQVFENLF